MAGVTAQGGTFTFAIIGGGGSSGFSARITSISVESPQAGAVDMTAITHDASIAMIAPTGEWSGGAATVDYIREGAADLLSHVRKRGTVTFSSAGFSVTKTAILESGTNQASTNDIVRGTLKFRFTDYTAT
jgi:hypothetical protein